VARGAHILKGQGVTWRADVRWSIATAICRDIDATAASLEVSIHVGRKSKQGLKRGRIGHLT
jgi:hypothetical protein